MALKNLRSDACPPGSKGKKWKWIERNLRKQDRAIEKDALQWKPQVERIIGRPRQTWRKSVIKELSWVGNTWRFEGLQHEEQNGTHL